MASLTRAACTILRNQVQSKFSILGAAYSNMANNHQPAELRKEWPKPSFDMKKMTELLDHDNLDMRQEMREFLRDPLFTPK